MILTAFIALNLKENLKIKITVLVVRGLPFTIKIFDLF
jgi:hypothetical protein